MKILFIVIVITYLSWKIFEILAYKWRAAFGRSSEQYAKMNWKAIKSLYKINPKKWKYDFGDPDEVPVRILYYKNTPIMLNTINFIKFRIAYKIYSHTYGYDDAVYVATRDVINDIQKDADSENDEAISAVIEEVRKSLKN